jgi:hypothetical protein
MNLNFGGKFSLSTSRYFRRVLLEETEVGHRKLRCTCTSSVLRSEIYEKREQILLTYQRETDNNKLRQKYLTSIT